MFDIESVTMEAQTETLCALGDMFIKQYIMEMEGGESLQSSEHSSVNDHSDTASTSSDPNAQSSSDQSKDQNNTNKSVSNWERIKNWLSRAVNVAISRIQDKRIQTLSDKCLKLQYPQCNIPKFDWTVFSDHADNPSNVDYAIEKSFDKSKGADYQKEYQEFKQNLDAYKQGLSVQKDKDKAKNQPFIKKSKQEIDKVIQSNMKSFQSHIKTAQSISQHVKENVSDEDKKSPEFQQYTRTVTIAIQAILYEVNMFVQFLYAIERGVQQNQKTANDAPNPNQQSANQNSTTPAIPNAAV